MAKKTSPLVPVLVGGAALAVVSKKKKKKRKSSHWGVRVVRGCDIEIVDDDLFARFVVGAFHELIEIDPNLDVFQLTDSMYGEVASDCATFPEEPASNSSVDFYMMLLKANTRHLMQKGLATKAEMAANPRTEEFVNWYMYWRNPSSPAVPPVPNNQVGFASDFSDYIIGPNWYSETVLPFVQSKKGELGVDMLMAFAEAKAVAVGKIAVPIVQLPAGPATVADFIDKLNEALERAYAEA